MDNGERTAKVETEVNSIQFQLHEIKSEQIRLWEAIDKLRDHTDQGFANQRDHTDQGFAEIRANLEDIRKEQTRTTRWLVSLSIGYGTAILGMMAKMAGLF